MTMPASAPHQPPVAPLGQHKQYMPSQQMQQQYAMNAIMNRNIPQERNPSRGMPRGYHPNMRPYPDPYSGVAAYSTPGHYPGYAPHPNSAHPHPNTAHPPPTIEQHQQHTQHHQQYYATSNTHPSNNDTTTTTQRGLRYDHEYF